MPDFPLDEETLDQELAGEGKLIDAAMQEAVRDALRRHKQLGQSVVVWHDGRTLWLSPDGIEMPEGEEETDEPV